MDPIGMYINNSLSYEQQYIIDRAKSIALACKKVSWEKCTKNIDSHIFLQSLAAYLETRNIPTYSWFSNECTNIKVRTNYIENLLQLVSNNDISGQIDFLQESNIKSFKGFFSQNLYNILSNRRKELENNSIDLLMRFPDFI